MGRTADADRRLFQLLLDFATTLASQTDARTNAAGRDGPDDHEVVDHDNGRRSALATLITRSTAVLDIEGIGSDLEWLPMSAAGVTIVVADVTMSGA